jgi:hypothetical protein
LPDPRNDRDFRGIIHLHGRVDREYAGPLDNEFVISSSDFGRALSLGRLGKPVHSGAARSVSNRFCRLHCR